MEKEQEDVLKEKYPENLVLERHQKGYTWKIRVFITDDSKAVERVKKIDEELRSLNE